MTKILVVDDDDAIRKVLRSFLERAHFAVVEAGTAVAALQLLDEQDRPDAVVSDVLMPGMNGLDFYRELTTRAPELKNRVIFLTGANRDPAVHQPIEQLGVPLLGKLDDLSIVVDALRIVLLKAARR
jgi:two-component system NtrC family sensor kinase